MRTAVIMHLKPWLPGVTTALPAALNTLRLAVLESSILTRMEPPCKTGIEHPLPQVRHEQVMLCPSFTLTTQLWVPGKMKTVLTSPTSSCT